MDADPALDGFRALVGEAGLLTAPDLTARYLTDQRDLVRGVSPAILRPRSTAEVQAVVRLARALGYGLVPQGGNTSYVGGATPDRSGRQLVVSLERMAGIREVDAAGFSLCADAGAVLADAQAAAEAHGLMLPLSLGAEGSCRLGGNIGTNAGGLNVLRFGMARDQVLGIEAVLADGTLFSDMRTLRKHNVGYDLKQLFIGGEGTLGIVTGVALKLVPKPVAHATAWVELADGAPLSGLLAEVRRESADLVSSFEFITRNALDLVKDLGTAAGLKAGPGGALIIELSASSRRVPLDALMEGILEGMMEHGWVSDAFLAQSESQRLDMWRLRETIPEGEKQAGGSVKLDISVPLSQLDAFLARARAAVRQHDPDLVLSIYGHVGDGNVHFNILVPKGADRLAFTREVDAGLAHDIYAIAADLGGAYSAEYGIGRIKRGLLERYADPVRLTLMRRIKAAFDPENAMNAGAMVDPVP
ncbi:FAD-binding oxidoreductase [Aquabacter spiritensis]|uniref:FAD/FMN-containing dehydrogenase n=1 Tax=Aquabacter spiritensis TaxID=933073 RepID=A0A4R3LSX3_9HYPH|nr:FAD-binding oxidoreductase [Aquabacter spiritensis]TCT02946.1 FAD/FMN-containing dehydrogenase [Aquabacter spiritensis]